MSDGPSKAAPPEALPLDDIILGDDDRTVPAPPRQRTAPPPAPVVRPGSDPGGGTPDRASARPGAPSDPPRDSKDARNRQKLTLRIPDDEVSRPQLPSTTPIGGVPAVTQTPSRPPSRPDPAEARPEKPKRPDLERPRMDVEATAVMPMRPAALASVSLDQDDTLELPAIDGARVASLLDSEPRQAVGIDASHEAGWTPFAPPVAERGDGRTIVDRVERHLPDELALADAPTQVKVPSAPPPLSEEIPIDTDDEPISRETPDDATSPRLPMALDSEDLKVDDGERHTDPGNIPEVDPDDLVSVESLPRPHHPAAKSSGSAVAVKGVPAGPALTATALMQGMTPPAPPVAAPLPLAQSLAQPVPTAPQAIAPQASPRVAPAADPQASPRVAPAADPQASPRVAPAADAHLGSQPPPPRQPSGPPPAAPSAPRDSAPAAASTTPVAATSSSARRSQALVPAVGVLAPPPMNESAANRKKTRPWWEDLFNDDFIRTMAKVTDADIAREANFIEESLGCEAGATILDLACGTGRHAVELATRGYQVVGFDLSLAMLARASDEAQDRKQKINFVQGDMREMTFEETFDGVFSWNTSFGFFDEEKNAAVVAKVHRSLKKGGQFLLDVVNRDYIIRQAPSLAWFEGDGCICMDEMQFDFITSRMKVKRTLMMDDGRTKEIEYSVRAYALHELGKLLHDNGFRVAEVSGRTGTPGVFFGCESPRTLILAEKR
ncbi:MAG: methyltransferase domain-containing protein [Deltaproteobacteria bacterium]|nr:methyltransferase domain-containing protein [Deltaproteobacteria bacterium]